MIFQDFSKKGFVISVYISYSVFHFMGECKEGKRVRGEIIQRDGRRNREREYEDRT